MEDDEVRNRRGKEKLREEELDFEVRMNREAVDESKVKGQNWLRELILREKGDRRDR